MRIPRLRWFRVGAWSLGLLGWVAGAEAQTTLPAAQVGQSYSYQVTTTPAAPAGTFYAATGLPSGISINSSSGLVSGTPGTPGAYSGLLELTSGGATNNLSYQLTVNAVTGTPVITSSASASATVGQAFSYTVTASNSPLSFNVGALPTGLNFSSPQITGTPTASGTFTVSLSANNGSGQGAAITLTLTISPAGPVPAITSATSAATAVNGAYTYTITASNSPTSFTASGLPLGLALNATTGVISGTPTVAGVYTVALGAANANGSGATTNLTLTVGAFSLITSSTTLNATLNQAASFSITASNSPISFNITGLPAGLSANAATGLISGTPTTAGNFTVSASANNALGTGPVTTVTLSVTVPGGGGGGGGGGVIIVAPSITSQPTNIAGASGGTAVFTVNAAGTPILVYQWFFNGGAIAGANSNTLSLNNLQAGNAGNYTVMVTNAAGSVTSAAAILTVTPTVTAPPSALAITTPPFNQTVTANAPVTFSVTATGATGYQWSFNGAPIAGATSSSYTIPAATIANSGSYTVTVSSSLGSTTSNGAILAVQAAGAPTVSLQPQSQTIAPGSTVVFAVNASGTVQTGSAETGSPLRAETAVPTSYQWYFDGIAMPGATASAFVLSGASSANAGTYNCLLSNSFGSTLSTSALLTVQSTSNPGRLVNLSVLSKIQGSLTMGFVIGGAGTTGAEPLLIRAVGPGVGPSTIFAQQNVLPDPTLTVVQQSTHASVATNTGWGNPASNVALVQAADTATGAFPLTDPTSADSALATSLLPSTGGYSVTVSGKSGDNGTALTEVYDDTATYALASTRLVNLSCLTSIAPNGSLSVGFVVVGSTSKTVLIRAWGPTLAAAPFNTAGTMPDPQLTVSILGNAAVLAANAGWAGDAGIATVAASIGAYPFISSTSKDSAMLLTVQPNNPYTVTVSSASGAAGTVLVEIYDVP